MTLKTKRLALLPVLGPRLSTADSWGESKAFLFALDPPEESADYSYVGGQSLGGVVRLVSPPSRFLAFPRRGLSVGE